MIKQPGKKTIDLIIIKNMNSKFIVTKFGRDFIQGMQEESNPISKGETILPDTVELLRDHSV